MKINPIGYIRTPFKEKFCIPRQSLNHLDYSCYIEIQSPYSAPEFFKGLEEYSHIWLHTHLHLASWNEKSTIRPPRLLGKRMGIFATRSPHRPNSLGLSLARLKNIQFKNQKMILEISLVDLLDKTPLLDIKPYIEKYDYANDSKEGWSQKIEENTFEVEFDQKALQKLKSLNSNPDEFNSKIDLIREVLKNDPRPTHLKDKSNKEYATKMFEYDVKFLFNHHSILITDVLAQV